MERKGHSTSVYIDNGDISESYGRALIFHVDVSDHFDRVRVAVKSGTSSNRVFGDLESPRATSSQPRNIFDWRGN